MNKQPGAVPSMGVRLLGDLHNDAAAVRDIPNELTELVCERFLLCNPEVVHLPSGHCPNWSVPWLVAQLLAARIEQVSG